MSSDRSEDDVPEESDGVLSSSSPLEITIPGFHDVDRDTLPDDVDLDTLSARMAQLELVSSSEPPWHPDPDPDTDGGAAEAPTRAVAAPKSVRPGTAPPKREYALMLERALQRVAERRLPLTITPSESFRPLSSPVSVVAAPSTGGAATIKNLPGGGAGPAHPSAESIAGVTTAKEDSSRVSSSDLVSDSSEPYPWAPGMPPAPGAQDPHGKPETERMAPAVGAAPVAASVAIPMAPLVPDVEVGGPPPSWWHRLSGPRRTMAVLAAVAVATTGGGVLFGTFGPRVNISFGAPPPAPVCPSPDATPAYGANADSPEIAPGSAAPASKAAESSRGAPAAPTRTPRPASRPLPPKPPPPRAPPPASPRAPPSTPRTWAPVDI